MKILVLAPQPFLEIRGTPLAVLAFVQTLCAAGHQVHLLTYPQGEDVSVPGLSHRRSLRLPVGWVPPGPSVAKLLLDVPFLLEACTRLLTGRYDAVHAVEEAAHLVSPVARLLRVPLVMDMDSSIPDQLRESGFARRGPLLWAAEALEGFALRSAAAVVTVCASLTESVRRRVPSARVVQIEDPPLVGGTEPPAEEVAALRASLGIGEEPVVFYSGNFESYQGVHLLLEAARLLPETRFVLMGGEEEQIRALKEPQGSVVFAGKRPPSELPAFLALSTVVVSPRIRGVNTPFKVYTYLASGKPLVATRIPTHTQLLDDSNATLVEPTPAGIAAGIREVLENPSRARERAAAGRSLVEAQFSRERYEEKVRSVYAEVSRPS